MGKEYYIEQLKEQLHEIMERPATLGRAEEITVYADAICALHKMGSHEDGEDTEFTREDAEKWVSHMENEDGTTGPHWSMSQTDAVANVAGVHEKSYVWWAVLNAMYSDHYNTAIKYGLDRPEFYADLARDFIYDKDGGGAENKTAKYYLAFFSD